MYASTQDIALLVRRRWPRCHKRELARVLGVSPHTALSYILGQRRMPAHRLRKLVEFLRADVLETQTSIMQLEYHAKQQDREWRPRTGMWVARDRGDGIVRDAVWRFGWPRRAG